ncbi:type II toxin-antitoxin system PemK/MazF family toxin [Cyanobacteria bacterium FACHB-DQ100]|uniref:type II toxin-antitoxin system PemK/MazF family toxin n=1 Tax=Leptolyngbya sp. DQ-M1 TaxID=2933920 RepID=UPI0019BC03F2|nr:type II toxin-antitoxin system PemK/MazF family toxin [Cyanobacteria bacterium FACHB-DQ100]
MTIQPGEFWVADISFTDGTASKKRPVLVLWLDGRDAIVAVVTSAQPRTQTDVMLSDWASSGLRVASTVRLSRLDCLESILLFSKLGRISEGDAALVKTVWDSQIKLQF